MRSRVTYGNPKRATALVEGAHEGLMPHGRLARKGLERAMEMVVLNLDRLEQCWHLIRSTAAGNTPINNHQQASSIYCMPGKG